jgi:deoxycytidylate deaminase
MSNSGIVDIRGKEYHTVAARIAKFRSEFPDYTIETELIEAGDERVVVKAFIANGPELISTGYAEEVRGSTNINKTSALENAETSAVGRALAFFGLAGTEIASTDEVANAVNQQIEKKIYADWAKYIEVMTDHYHTLIAVRDELECAYARQGDAEASANHYSAAREAWNEVSNEDKMILWRATTKGGWFTPLERQQMKYWSNDFLKDRKDGSR